MKTLTQILAVIAAVAVIAAPGALAQLSSAEHSHGTKQGSQDSSSAKAGNSPLIDKVRAATARYLDINVALHEPEPWVPGTPCVSGPNAGAMGVHYIKPSRVFDGVLNANEPEGKRRKGNHG